MRRQRDLALVIQRTPLGESDLRVELLCRTAGKLTAVAPGARASRRRFSGCLDLFCQIDVQLVDRGRGGLFRLEEASLKTAHPGLRVDLCSIGHAGYATELCAGLTREGQEARAFFDLLEEALARLERGPWTALELRVFELRALGLAGAAPALEACIRCRTREAEAWFFDYDQGGVVCAACGPGPRSDPLSAPTRALLVALASGSGLLAPAGESLREVRAILDQLIAHQIGRPLHAREFLRQLARSRE